MTELTCADASEDVAEPLAGTAVESVTRWLLLEVNAPWTPKAIETEALPSEVRQRLERWVDETPGSRLQFIRKPGRTGRAVTLIGVSSDRGGVSRLELDDYDAFMRVDLERLYTEATAEEKPICLVCVHGRRDMCCARHGSVVFRSLKGHEIDLWQTSHLGGHRFAACALWLPQGLLYGRLRAEHAEDFVAAQAAGELGDLTLFRGRCDQARPAQAAEIFLRGRLGETAIDAVRWVSTTPTSETSWAVRFDVRGTGEREVGVRFDRMDGMRPTSCGKEPEPVYRFLEI